MPSGRVIGCSPSTSSETPAAAPHARIETLAHLTHFALPTAAPAETDRRVADFLAAGEEADAAPEEA